MSLIYVHDLFPNVIVALRIYLTLPSSNASGERSFSCLKRVKNQLRSTQKQERLSEALVGVSKVPDDLWEFW
jgi:hypothetical protein